MAHASGKAGGVYTGALEVEDCEDKWDESVDVDVTETADGTDYKVGAASAKFECAAGLGAGDIVATEVIAKNLTTYDVVYAWMKSSVALSSGDWQLLLDDNANCASPTETLNIPALGANTWTQVCLVLSDPSLCGALISIGLKQVVDKGAMNFWIDDVEALAMVDGIKSWSLDYNVEMLDVTDFGSSGTKEYTPGITGWSGSFEGFKDGVPLGIGSEVHLSLRETQSTGQCWTGKAIISKVTPKTDVDGIVSYSYDFQGTGNLSVASA